MNYSIQSRMVLALYYRLGYLNGVIDSTLPSRFVIPIREDRYAKGHAGIAPEQFCAMEMAMNYGRERYIVSVEAMSQKIALIYLNYCGVFAAEIEHVGVGEFANALLDSQLSAMMSGGKIRPSYDPGRSMQLSARALATTLLYGWQDLRKQLPWLHEHVRLALPEDEPSRGCTASMEVRTTARDIGYLAGVVAASGGKLPALGGGSSEYRTQNMVYLFGELGPTLNESLLDAFVTAWQTVDHKRYQSHLSHIADIAKPYGVALALFLAVVNARFPIEEVLQPIIHRGRVSPEDMESVIMIGMYELVSTLNKCNAWLQSALQAVH